MFQCLCIKNISYKTYLVNIDPSSRNCLPDLRIYVDWLSRTVCKLSRLVNHYFVIKIEIQARLSKFKRGTYHTDHDPNQRRIKYTALIDKVKLFLKQTKHQYIAIALDQFVASFFLPDDRINFQTTNFKFIMFRNEFDETKVW